MQWTTGVRRTHQGPCTCEFPKASDNALVVVIHASGSRTLSTVSIVGQDAVTEAQKLLIREGDRPLYIIAHSPAAMIWQLKGSTARIEHLVLASFGGVTGLPADKVSFANWRCLTISNEWKHTADVVTRSVGKAQEELLASSSLYNDGQATKSQAGEHRTASENLEFERNVAKPFSGRGDRIAYETLLRNHPGGVAEIDASTVVASTNAEPYTVMPAEAGIVQLVEQGVLVGMGDGSAGRLYSIGTGKLVPMSSQAYKIVKPIPRFPAGLHGGHSLKFVIANGVPLPAGKPGHSTVYTEAGDEVVLVDQPPPDIRRPVCRSHT